MIKSFTKSLKLTSLVLLAIVINSSCKKAEPDIIKEAEQTTVLYSYEVTCDYCNISYTDATNQIKTISSNVGKWSYKIQKQVSFDLKLSVASTTSTYQTIQAYILKDEDPVYGNLGYNRAEISYNMISGNGTSSFGSYVSTTPNGGNGSGGGTTAPISSVCGAKNKTGGYCKRVVVGGGRCWQHK